MNISSDKFISYLKSKSLKDRTIENYIYYFNKFIYPSFNQESVSRFLAKPENQNSVSRGFLLNLQKFLKMNYVELGLSKELKDEVVDVEFPKRTGRTAHRVIKPLSEEQIMLLEKVLETEQIKIRLLLSYYCGLRLGELVNIRITSFYWEEWGKDMEQVGECVVHGKGDKERIAYVPSFLMKRIAKFAKTSNFDSINSRLLFKDNLKMSKHLGSDWQHQLRDAGIKSGITQLDNSKVVEGTGVHPHKLRHSFATYLKDKKGMDIFDIKELMGHSTISTTQIYLTMDKQELKKKLNILFSQK